MPHDTYNGGKITDISNMFLRQSKNVNMSQKNNNTTFAQTRKAIEDDIAAFKEALNDGGLTDNDKQMIQSAISTAEKRLLSLDKENNSTEQATVSVKATCPPMDEKGTRLITPEALALLSKCIADEPDTKALHTDKAGNYTKERKELHEKILSELNNQECIEQRRPIAILMGGLPGSGKSTFLSKNLKWVTDDNFYWIDADQIREKLPEYKGWNASNTHNETKELVGMAIENIAKNCKYDVIYDGTMTSKSGYDEMLKSLRENNYKVFVIYLNIDTDTAVQRALNRYVVSGRYVPIEVIKATPSGMSGFDHLKDKVDGYVIVDGQTGTITEKKGEEIPPNRPFDYIAKKEKVKRVSKADINNMRTQEEAHSRKLEENAQHCECGEEGEVSILDESYPEDTDRDKLDKEGELSMFNKLDIFVDENPNIPIIGSDGRPSIEVSDLEALEARLNEGIPTLIARAQTRKEHEARKKLREHIIKNFKRGKIIRHRRPIAILLNGLPYCDKRGILDSYFKWINRTNFTWIDESSILTQLPEYEPWLADMLHPEARHICQGIIKSIKENQRYDFVYDATMLPYQDMVHISNRLSTLDYDVFHIRVLTDHYKSAMLMQYNYRNGGNYVNVGYIFDYKTGYYSKIDEEIAIDERTGETTMTGNKRIPESYPEDTEDTDTLSLSREDIVLLRNYDSNKNNPTEKKRIETILKKFEQNYVKNGGKFIADSAYKDALSTYLKNRLRRDSFTEEEIISLFESEKKGKDPEHIEYSRYPPFTEEEIALLNQDESERTAPIPEALLDKLNDSLKRVEYRIGIKVPPKTSKKEKDIDPLTEDAPHPELKNQSKQQPETSKGIDSDFLNVIDTAVNGSAEHQAEAQLKSSLKTLSTKSTKGLRTHKPYKRAEKGQYRLVIPDNELTIENKTLNYQRADVFLVPLSDIEINTALFQNREEEYSKETFENLDRAYKQGDFYLEVMDPILLYREPTTDKLFTINHSRFAWFKHALKNGYILPKNKNFDFSHIPARIIDGSKVSLEKIIQIARNSNNLATPEKVYERVIYYHQRIEAGADEKKIIDEIGRHELYNSKMIKSAIHLNPQGKAFEWIKKLSEDIENPPNIRNIVYIVGELRRRHKDLTNAHENELTNWLIDGGYGINAGQVRTLTEADEKITRLIEKITKDGHIEQEKPLNPKQLLSKNYVRSEWEKTLKVATNALRIAEKELANKSFLHLEKAAKEKQSHKEVGDAVFKATSIERSNVLSRMKDVRNALLIKPNLTSMEKQAIEIFDAA